MAQKFARLYAIADTDSLARHCIELRDYAEALLEAGVMLVQLRNKTGPPQKVLAHAAVLRQVFTSGGCRLIMNDRADYAPLAEFDGVHIGQDDLSPRDARRVVGAGRTVGVSAHNDEQVRRADASEADYIAVGPVFATSTKLDAEPVVGLEGVRRARALTAKPLVAIGGITVENVRSVVDAGADSVAVIGGLLTPRRSVRQTAEDFLELLR